MSVLLLAVLLALLLLLMLLLILMTAVVVITPGIIAGGVESFSFFLAIFPWKFRLVEALGQCPGLGGW